MEAYYDQVAANDLHDNDFLRWANKTFDALPVPTLIGPRWLHLLITPLWRAATPALTRPARTCAEAAAHPRTLDLLGVEWPDAKNRELPFLSATLTYNGESRVVE